MKKILYTLFMVSILSVACTQEVLVSRDHDLNAEVGDMHTKSEMKALYCNLNEAQTLNLQKLSEYLTEQSADVAMFVAPASVGGENFKTWLKAYATEVGELTLVDVLNYDGRLLMAALVKEQWPVQTYNVAQGQALKNAVLHFETNNIHFVVTELDPARNAIPSNWESQVNTMTTNKKTVPLEYDPDNLAIRKAELANIIKQTIDSKANMKETHWMWAINMNADSPLDLTKYDFEYLREECYDPADTDDFDWAEFLSKETKFFSIEELLDKDDAYFGLNALMLSRNMVDCNAVHHSIYTPSSIGEGKGSRNNFLYASDECWNMFQTFDFDTEKAAELGVTHYPIIVTLKSEE